MAKKKVLILSASIGTGHTQAARAIEEYVKTIPEECDVEHVDFLSNDILSIDNIVKETYIKILDVFPLLYDLMYYSSQGYKKGLAVKTLFAWGLKRRLLKVLADRKPDVLVFTHPFPAGAAALLKRQHRLNIPLVGVITDFAIHQLWVYPQIDVYCVAATQINRESRRIKLSCRAFPYVRLLTKNAGTGMRNISIIRISLSWAAVWEWGLSDNPWHCWTGYPSSTALPL